MPSIRRFLKNRFLLAAVLTLVGLSAAASIVWTQRRAIASRVIHSQAASLGLNNLTFELTTLDLHQARLEKIAFETEAASIEVISLALTYSLNELRTLKRIQTVEANQATITLLPNASTTSSDSPLPTDLAPYLSYLDLSTFTPLPFDRIQVSDSQLNADFLPFPLRFNTTANATSPTSLSFALDATADSLQLTANATLSTTEVPTFAATLSTPTPITLLQSQAPDLLAFLPDATLASGPLLLEFSHSPNLPFHARLLLESPNFEYEELTAAFNAIEFTAELANLNHIPFTASLDPTHIAYDTASLTSTDPVHLTGSLANQSTLSLATTTPLAWDNDQTIQGHSSLSLTFDSTSPSAPLSGQVKTSYLTVTDYQLQPFTLPFSGSLETLTLDIPPLSLDSSATPITSASSATLEIPEDDSAPIIFAWKTELTPSAFPHALAASVPTRHSLDLLATVAETSTELSLKLNTLPTPNTPLFTLDAATSATGNLQTTITLLSDDSTVTYSGTLALNASNLSIHLPDLAASEASLILSSTFANLPQTLLDSPDDASLISTLLHHSQTSLDWQANQISAPDLKAQWSGGSLKLASSDDSLLLTSEQMLGALILPQLRIEQVYLESSLAGSLETLTGKTSASALLDGIPLELSLDHTLAQPLAAPYLSGNYSLSPITFTYSDLLGRIIPDLTGSSFSATLSATGNFQASTQDSDTSLNLSLADASFDFPPSKLSASGIALESSFDSLRSLDSSSKPSLLTIASIQAGDFEATDASLAISLANGTSLSIPAASVAVLGGHATLQPMEIPLDGSDFSGEVTFNRLDLNQVSEYIEIFRGSMQGNVSGYLPFAFLDGAFVPQRGELSLASGETATLRYPAKGLLTGDPSNAPPAKPSFSDRLLKFLKIEPEAMAENALGNVTLDAFHAELFPPDSPDTPMKIHLSGTARTEEIALPIVIDTRVHGSLSELYNFLIRLNSI